MLCGVLTSKMKHNIEYNYKSSSHSLLVGLSLACLVVPARSQENGNQLTYELDAFTLTASRIEIPVQQVGSTVDVLDAGELSRGQDLFLVDALRDVPGLVMRNNGGPGGVFGTTVRGLSSNRPTVLINGIEVSNPSNGEIMNLGNLFTGSASRVEILRGPQSSLYGADALAGVISVDTLGVDSAAGGRALLGYGSYDSYDYGLGHTGSRGALSWSIDGMIHESEGISSQPESNGPAWADEDGYDNTSLNSAIRYQVNDDVSLHASALYLDTYSEFDPSYPAWGTPQGDNYATAEQMFARIGSDFRIRDNWTSTANFAYSDVETLSYTDGDEYFASGKRYKYDWVNTVNAVEAWTFVTGVEYEKEENVSDIGDRDDSSIFVENVLKLFDRLDLTLGGRYDDNSAYGEEFTYRATFSYRIEDLDARVRGSLGSSFQAPNFYQLLNPYYGNRDLKPETGKGWDLGFEKTFLEGRLQASSTVFGNKVSDKISWDGVYKNVSEYESVGVENALSYYLSPALRFKAAYTYSDAEENGGQEALRVPRSVGSLGVNWVGLDGKLSLNLDALFLSSQYSNGSERLAGRKQSGYEVVNLAASYQLHELYSLWMRVGNVLDSEYEEIAGYQTYGANAQAGIRFNF